MDEEKKNPIDLNEKMKSELDQELSSYMNNLKAKNPPENPAPVSSAIPVSPVIAPEKPSASSIADSSSIENLIKNISANKKTEEKPPVEIPVEATPVQAPQAPIKKPIVRTYKSDVEETIQTGHISSVNIAVAEQGRMRNKIASDMTLGDKKGGINKNIVILSLILIFGGLMAILIPYFLVQKQANPNPVQVETVPSGAFMTADVEEKINLSDINLDRFATTIKERVDQSALTLGEIKNIYFTEGEGTAETTITAQKFLTLLNANVPPEILRTLQPQYMFGMYAYNGNQRFLILRVGSYDTTFAGMLAWEVNLWQDFKEPFALADDTPVATTTIASGTTSNLSGLEVKKFEDASFDNKNARVVRDSSGNIIFLYSIIDNNTVVITTSVDTLHEIIRRMGQGKVSTQ